MWHFQTKFMTHWVTHGDDHSTHILHPTLGHASVLCKKDRYQSCFSCYHLLISFIPIPASLYNLIHPAPEPNLKIKPQLPQSVSPWMLSLSTPLPKMTLTVIVPVGINITINDFRFCMQYK